MRLELQPLAAEQSLRQIREVGPDRLIAEGKAQNLPRLFFHGAPVPRGAHAQLGLHRVSMFRIVMLAMRALPVPTMPAAT